VDNQGYGKPAGNRRHACYSRLVDTVIQQLFVPHINSLYHLYGYRDCTAGVILYLQQETEYGIGI
jgi:hypothetical protein